VSHTSQLAKFYDMIGGMIAFLNSQGVEQKDIAMQSDAKELSRPW
jgi:hypothetical protein